MKKTIINYFLLLIPFFGLAQNTTIPPKEIDYKNAGVIAYSIKDNKAQILLGYDERGFWSDFVGVKEEKDMNDPIKTALREFNEETRGVFDKESATNKLKISPFVIDDTRLWIVEVTNVDIATIKGKPTDKNTEMTDYKWFPLKEFLTRIDNEKVAKPNLTDNELRIAASKNFFEGTNIRKKLDEIISSIDDGTYKTEPVIIDDAKTKILDPLKKDSIPDLVVDIGFKEQTINRNSKAVEDNVSAYDAIFEKSECKALLKGKGYIDIIPQSGSPFKNITINDFSLDDANTTSKEITRQIIDRVAKGESIIKLELKGEYISENKTIIKSKTIYLKFLCGAGKRNCEDCPKKQIEVAKLNIDMCMPDCKEVYMTGAGKRCGNRKGKLLVRQNQMTAIKLINYNPLRYKIDIQGIEESLNQEDATAYSVNYGTVSGIIKKSTATTDEDRSLERGDESLQKNANATKNIANRINSIADSIASIIKLWTDLKNEKARLMAKPCLDKKDVDLIFAKYDSVYKSIIIVTGNSAEILNNVKTIKKYNDILSDAVLNSKVEREAEEEALIAASQDTTDITKEIELAENNLETLEQNDDIIDELKDEVNENVKPKLIEIEQILAELLAVQTEIYTLPYEVKGKNIDYIQFKIEKTDLLNNVKTIIPYNVFLRGGVKLDFSTGLMVSALSDNKYRTIDSSNTGKQQIIRENKNNFSFLVAALMNVSFRVDETIHLGISTGLGFSTDTKFQLLNGIFLGLGKFQRFLVHGGVTVGAVDRLKRPYYENGVFTNVSNITTPTIMASWFVGITYNITRTKAENPAQNTTEP